MIRFYELNASIEVESFGDAYELDDIESQFESGLYEAIDGDLKVKELGVSEYAKNGNLVMQDGWRSLYVMGELLTSFHTDTNIHVLYNVCIDTHKHVREITLMEVEVDSKIAELELPVTAITVVDAITFNAEDYGKFTFKDYLDLLKAEKEEGTKGDARVDRADAVNRSI